MSTEAVAEFLKQVSSDPALQSDLGKALEADNDREAVTTLAKSKGYDFSPDELWSEVQKRQTEFQSRQASGDLSDEELEAIAGGTAVTEAAPTLTMVLSNASISFSPGMSISPPLPSGKLPFREHSNPGELKHDVY